MCRPRAGGLVTGKIRPGVVAVSGKEDVDGLRITLGAVEGDHHFISVNPLTGEDRRTGQLRFPTGIEFALFNLRL